MRRSIFLSTGNFLCLLLIITSCASYKQNIMFKVPEGYALAQHVEAAEKNYIIQKNDYLTLEVYTNNGERLIDPNFILSKENPEVTNSTEEIPTYLINSAGTTTLPMVGVIALEGLTLSQAEEILVQAYAKFYQQPFVKLTYTNKRVVVLGVQGGYVVPLKNENMKLAEILALAKGINNDAIARNFRVLRGDQTFLIDFTTVEGFVKNNITMEPGDIVYVEPVRKPFVEIMRDYAPLFTIFTSLATLAILVLSLK